MDPRTERSACVSSPQQAKGRGLQALPSKCEEEGVKQLKVSVTVSVMSLLGHRLWERESERACWLCWEGRKWFN